jgi:hypothetical protein
LSCATRRHLLLVVWCIDDGTCSAGRRIDGIYLGLWLKGAGRPGLFSYQQDTQRRSNIGVSYESGCNTEYFPPRGSGCFRYLDIYGLLHQRIGRRHINWFLFFLQKIPHLYLILSLSPSNL